jgi:hypothetical protein
MPTNRRDVMPVTTSPDNRVSALLSEPGEFKHRQNAAGSDPPLLKALLMTFATPSRCR